MKMPTIVGIFIFISREIFYAQLSWAWKKFYNLKPGAALIGLHKTIGLDESGY